MHFLRPAKVVFSRMYKKSTPMFGRKWVIALHRFFDLKNINHNIEPSKGLRHDQKPNVVDSFHLFFCPGLPAE